MNGVPGSGAWSHLGAHALLISASTPAPSPSPTGSLANGRLGPFIPQENVPNQDGAGWIAFVIVVGMIIVSIGLFKAMSGSLRRARRNLGADPLPMPAGTHLAARARAKPPVVFPIIAPGGPSGAAPTAPGSPPPVAPSG